MQDCCSGCRSETQQPSLLDLPWEKRKCCYLVVRGIAVFLAPGEKWWFLVEQIARLLWLCRGYLQPVAQSPIVLFVQ